MRVRRVWARMAVQRVVMRASQICIAVVAAIGRYIHANASMKKLCYP